MDWFSNFRFSLVELKRKMNFIKLTFEGLGVQLISDEMMEVIFNLFDHLKNSKYVVARHSC